MNIEKRREIEKRIATATIAALVAAGYHLRVNYDGEQFAQDEPTQDQNALIDSMMACDAEILQTYKPRDDSSALKWYRTGMVFFVYGNDGYDVINDYSVSLGDALTDVNDLCDQIEKEVHNQ